MHKTKTFKNTIDHFDIESTRIAKCLQNTKGLLLQKALRVIKGARNAKLYLINLGCQNRKSFSSGGVALKGSSKPIHQFLFNNVAVSILLLSPLPCKDCTSGPRRGGGRGRRGLGDLFVCKDRHNIGIKNGTGTFL